MENSHPKIPIFEYDHITDGIYIGTNQCCQIHFDEKLKQEGITADISLEEDGLDAPFDVDFYVWISVKNHAVPKRDQLEFGISILEKLVAMGKKVYVHCKNGHGRAPTLAASYLIRKGKNAEEAETFFKSRRPSMHLDDIRREALQEFVKSH